MDEDWIRDVKRTMDLRGLNAAALARLMIPSPSPQAVRDVLQGKRPTSRLIPEIDRVLGTGRPGNSHDRAHAPHASEAAIRLRAAAQVLDSEALEKLAEMAEFFVRLRVRSR